jgi:hypothetical protein
MYYWNRDREELMGNCYKHPAAPASATCTSCAKEICQECLTQSEEGPFCSVVCRDIYREMKSWVESKGSDEPSSVSSAQKMPDDDSALDLGKLAVRLPMAGGPAPVPVGEPQPAPVEEHLPQDDSLFDLSQLAVRAPMISEPPPAAPTGE